MYRREGPGVVGLLSRKGCDEKRRFTCKGRICKGKDMGGESVRWGEKGRDLNRFQFVYIKEFIGCQNGIHVEWFTITKGKDSTQ